MVLGRVLLFVGVAVAGWLAGSMVGLLVGIPVELLVVQPADPGAAVSAPSWGFAMIGAPLGAGLAAIWLGLRLSGATNRDRARVWAVMGGLVILLIALMVWTYTQPPPNPPMTP